MSGTSTTILPLSPPANEAPLANDGQHTQAWAAHHQSVADELYVTQTTLQQVQAALAVVHKGVTDGSNAAAGDVGEYLEASGSGVVLTNNVASTVATLSLTAGDWDVSGQVSFNAGPGTHTYFTAGIDSAGDMIQQGTMPTTAITPANVTSVHRYSVTGTTTVPLAAQAGFTGSVTADGTIRARRVR